MGEGSFKLTDVLEIGKQIEKQGWGFYINAAGVVKDSTVGRLMIALANAETNHEKTFDRLMAEERALGEDGCAKCETWIIKDFLQAWGKDAVFFPEDGLRVDPDILPVVILDQAIEFEKRTIRFYTELKAFLCDPRHVKVLNRIIDQEKTHIRLILGVKEKLGH